MVMMGMMMLAQVMSGMRVMMGMVRRQRPRRVVAHWMRRWWEEKVGRR